jgi:hypothetical protein
MRLVRNKPICNEECEKDTQMRKQYVVVNIYFELMSKLKHDIGRLINIELQQGMVCSLTLQER